MPFARIYAFLLHARLSVSRRPLKNFFSIIEKSPESATSIPRKRSGNARLDPRRPANSLSRTDSAKLHKAIVSVLHRALEMLSGPAARLS